MIIILEFHICDVLWRCKYLKDMEVSLYVYCLVEEEVSYMSLTRHILGEEEVSKRFIYVCLAEEEVLYSA